MLCQRCKPISQMAAPYAFVPRLAVFSRKMYETKVKKTKKATRKKQRFYKSHIRQACQVSKSAFSKRYNRLGMSICLSKPVHSSNLAG